MNSKKKMTATKDDGKPMLVPKLRFPQFRDNWSESLLGSVVKEYRQNSSVQNEYEVLTSARRGLMKQVDYYGEGRITERDNVGFNVIPADYVTYRSRTDDGRFYFNHNDLGITGVISVYYPVFSSVTGSNAFLASLLNHFSILIGSHSVGTSQRVLPISKLLRVTLPIPSPAEQQKIAECLSSVDELMAAQGRKVDALKTHKKGLMQQLFPREGETQPRRRFPEFQNAGEWTDAPMGTLLVSSPDYGVNAAAVPFSEHLPKYLRITDISEDGRYLPEKQVSVDIEATDGNYLDEGDIVLARTGASVGKSYQYRKEDGRLVFAGFLIRVKPRPKKLVSTYLANFLTTGQFWKWVAVTSARSGQPGINSTEYSSLTIPLPPSLPEQERIATCLSSLDALITAETQKLEALKTHKKGLMQQLFPSTEEIES